MRCFTGWAPTPLPFSVTKSGLPLWIGYLVAPFCSAALGLVLGLITVRLNRLYFGMLQISLGSLVWAITYRWYAFTGGDDGIHGIPSPGPGRVVGRGLLFQPDRGRQLAC
jgi:branched-chain amino acid transport system permease protein